MPHITYIVTDPITVRTYLVPQFQALSKRNWKISVICGGDRTSLPAPEELHGATLYHVPMRREIHPLRDAVALIHLFAILLRLRPAIVNAGTPKAGLLGMIASRLALVPQRIYQLHGLRLETAVGRRRRLFLMTERVACQCSSKVLCVSRSLRRKLIELGVCRSEKLAVLGSGSCAGIHVEDYAPTPERVSAAARLRDSLRIPRDAPVIGFVGRLTRDKGIVDLWKAFGLIQKKLSGAYLLLIGPFEAGDPVPSETRQRLVAHERVRHIEWTDDPKAYFHLMDVFVLPTYREGLPGVLLEAAAAEIPMVATNATGVVDVIASEETGLVSAIGDADSLADNILRVLLNPDLGRELSRRARCRVETAFSRQEVMRQLDAFYMDCLLQRHTETRLDRFDCAGT